MATIGFDETSGIRSVLYTHLLLSRRLGRRRARGHSQVGTASFLENQHERPEAEPALTYTSIQCYFTTCSERHVQMSSICSTSLSATDKSTTDMEDLLQPRSHQASHSSTHNPHHANADSNSWPLASQPFDHVADVSAVLQQETLSFPHSPGDYQYTSNTPRGHLSAGQQDQDVNAPFPVGHLDSTSPSSARYSDGSQSVRLTIRERPPKCY